MTKYQSGQLYEITSIDESHPHAQNLIRLGFLPGKQIQIRSRAPLGDPTMVVMDNHCYMIRNEEMQALLLDSIPA